MSLFGFLRFYVLWICETLYLFSYLSEGYLFFICALFTLKYVSHIIRLWQDAENRTLLSNLLQKNSAQVCIFFAILRISLANKSWCRISSCEPYFFLLCLAGDGCDLLVMVECFFK